MIYRESFLALCDGCRCCVPGCLRVHLRANGRQFNGRRYGKFGTETRVLCAECRAARKWRDKFKVAAEHR